MKNKAMFHTGLTVGQRGPDVYMLRELAKSDPTAFTHKIERLTAEGHLSLAKIKDLRALYASLADIQVPVQMEFVDGVKRSIMASAFPILTGSTIVAAINAAYNQIETIGQDLVEDIEDAKKITTIAALHNLDKNIAEVKDGDEFPEISSTEESVEIRHKQNGRRLSITANMISENQVADIVQRVNALGVISSDWIEEQTLERVTDHYGSAASPAEPYAYRPGGTGTQLYNHTANYPGTRAPSGTRIRNNGFADDSDLDAARTVLAAMVNNRGKRIAIPWSEVQILCPNAILAAVSKVFNSEYVPGVINEKSNYGPVGRWYLSPDRVKSSPKVDDLSTTAWYLGAFKRQFRRKWKLRMEYVTLGMDTESYLKSRIAFQARIAWDVEVGAVDYVYVVQNLTATTAPADE